MALFLFLASVVVSVLTGCGGGGSGGTAVDAKTPNLVAPGAPSQPSNPSTPQNVSLTYYTKTLTEAPVSGWSLKTYTAKGSCVLYLTKSYCWDDGLKTIPSWTFSSSNYGPYSYTYWQVGLANGTPSLHCYGTCESSMMTTPTVVAVVLANNLPVSKVNDVFATGTPKNVSCTLVNTTLSCVDFTIDLSQVPF